MIIKAIETNYCNWGVFLIDIEVCTSYLIIKVN